MLPHLEVLFIQNCKLYILSSASNHIVRVMHRALFSPIQLNFPWNYLLLIFLSRILTKLSRTLSSHTAVKAISAVSSHSDAISAFSVDKALKGQCKKQGGHTTHSASSLWPTMSTHHL